VSLSQNPAFSLLKSDFVCGYRDITGAPWSGVSGLHPVDGGAIYTTNGAGPHNIQMFVLSPDGVVLTCLPGYWRSADLALELQLAERLHRIWADPRLTRAQKNALFARMHGEHIRQHPAEMVAHSELQNFDKKFEARRRLQSSDTILAASGGDPRYGGVQFKTTDVILHERMAQRPFVPYAQFDVANFSDYGRAKYDKKEVGGTPAVDLRQNLVERRPRLRRKMRGF
jgi:hypothetical protein